ncbi:hypothetical protein BBK36DRAFT_1168769 [Trichoderma citrinoviride]|uniref:SigF-like NTF2-like domain-containing protein n=1 Tax=Trichoderma citrinoviride TaxID=58853 RepID=A0A2T4BA02_9HYPO|nr:hypothetical protein BBK36DRAFT_1168769 [Trichoderma citrinoviride]PTB66144.1 hypothetical protein BBK36DRAFT_1168769 [Trichoderma citrinoviride]
MENPVQEIAAVINALTKGTPQQQQDTLNTYFLSNASFTHPFCRVPSFSRGSIPLARDLDSRWLILGIYRWYRTLSPKINLTVDSSVFDQRTNTLYVSIRQTFSIWFIPLHSANVKLLSVLRLAQGSSSEPGQLSPPKYYAADGRGSAVSSALAGPGQERLRYYIASQEDLYQTNDFVAFVVPYLGPLLVLLWQLYSTGVTVVCSILFLPLYYFMNSSRVKVTGRA